MSPQIKNAIIVGGAMIVGIAFAVLVNSPEDASLTTRLAYHAIGFLIGFIPVALGLGFVQSSGIG